MELLCFDLDNTLINSEKAHFYSYNFALKKYGYKTWKFHELTKLFGRPHLELISLLIGGHDAEIISKILKVKQDYLRNVSYKKVRTISGVKSVLRKLGKNYDLAILSNSSHGSILAMMKGAKLDKKIFKLIIGNDDVRHSKPYPDEILKAEKLLHHKAKFMIGDSIYDIMAGKKAKVKTIGVLTGRYSRSDLKKYKPDFIIKNLGGLIKILK